MINIQSFINKQALLDIRLGYRPKTINFKAITATLKETPEETFVDIDKLSSVLSRKTKDEVFVSNENPGRFKHADSQSKIMLEMFNACRRHWLEALDKIDVDVVMSSVDIETVYEKQLEKDAELNSNYSIDMIEDIISHMCKSDDKYERILFTTGITGYKKVLYEKGTSNLYMIFENAAKIQVLKIIIK